MNLKIKTAWTSHYKTFESNKSAWSCLWPCSLALISTGRVGLWFCGGGGGGLCTGAPEGSTGSGSDFKAPQKTGPRLKVSSDRLGEAGNRTCDPEF